MRGDDPQSHPRHPFTLSSVSVVDELVVIDSRSEDRTREIAEEEGVPVFIHDESFPRRAATRKSEALWKSLHVLTGDIVVWIDTDVTSAHPKFVYASSVRCSCGPTCNS